MITQIQATKSMNQNTEKNSSQKPKSLDTGSTLPWSCSDGGQ